jgi:phosphatidylglycerophosphatase C
VIRCPSGQLAVGGRDDDVAVVAEAYEETLTRKPEAAVAEAIACVRAHRADGDVVVVATGCEEVLARGYLRSVGLGDLEVVGSTGSLRPPRIRRAMGATKVAMLAERGYAAVAGGLQRQRLGPPAVRRHPAAGAREGRRDAAREVERTLGRRPEAVTWR